MKSLKDIELNQETLKEVLNYDENTGIFTNCKTGKIMGIGGNSHGYIALSIFGKRYLAHRIAWLYVYGEFPKNQIDHINHDKVDNRIENLRDITARENLKSRMPFKRSVPYPERRKKNPNQPTRKQLPRDTEKATVQLTFKVTQSMYDKIHWYCEGRNMSKRELLITGLNNIIDSIPKSN